MSTQVHTEFVRGVVLSAAECHSVDVEAFCTRHVDLFNSGEFDSDDIVVGVKSDVEHGDAICLRIDAIQFDDSHDIAIMRTVNSISAEISRRNGTIGYVPCQQGDIHNLVITSLR